MLQCARASEKARSATVEVAERSSSNSLRTGRRDHLQGINLEPRRRRRRRSGHGGARRGRCGLFLNGPGDFHLVADVRRQRAFRSIQPIRLADRRRGRAGWRSSRSAGRSNRCTCAHSRGAGEHKRHVRSAGHRGCAWRLTFDTSGERHFLICVRRCGSGPCRRGWRRGAWRLRRRLRCGWTRRVLSLRIRSLGADSDRHHTCTDKSPQCPLHCFFSLHGSGSKGAAAARAMRAPPATSAGIVVTRGGRANGSE